MLLTRDLGRTDRQTETKMDGWTAHYKSPAERVLTSRPCKIQFRITKLNRK